MHKSEEVRQPRDAARPRRLRSLGGSLSLRRQLLGLGLTIVGLPLLTWQLVSLRSTSALTADVLVYQLVVVVVALVGGIWPALLAAVGAGFALDYFFEPPPYVIRIAEPADFATLIIFMIVAALVSLVVDQAARRLRTARSSALESEILAAVASGVIAGSDAIDALVSRLREALRMGRVALVSESSTISEAVDAASATPHDQESKLEIRGSSSLILVGRPLQASDRRIVSAFVSQLDSALERRRLAEEAERMRPLEAADRLRSALLAAVGHDLRRPLAAATAAVSSLRSMEVTLSDRDRTELLETADESLADLARLVTDLLDASRLEAGVLGVTLEPVIVDETVGDALDELRLAPGAVRLELSETPTALADPALLQRALVNILANALRHSPTPPVITSIAYDDRVELRIVDAGPGVPPNRRDEMFQPFQRLGDTDNTAGVGLGLALSKGFVEAMNGTLKALDTPGGGLTMVVELGGGMKVLIADDDPQILRALRITLTARGYDVLTAPDGRAALDLAIEEHPDLLVLDLGMPGLTGIEVIEALRGWTQIPILVVSGRSESFDKVDALDAGADDYVTKPFAADELLARIRALSRRTTAATDEPAVTFGDVTVDRAAHIVTRAGIPVRLTPTEWHLLEVLLRNRDRLVPRELLLREVWGPQYTTDTGYLRLYLAQLRKKLEPVPSAPRYLVTEPGMGYRFASNAAES